MSASDNAIIVSGLTKEFNFPVKDPKKNWFSNLLSPEIRTIQAVCNVSFSVSKGERVAFIGPNGAGKSTTIKMLTGILFPSRGNVNVLGLDPTVDRKKLAYKIGTVFGQRSQLLPNLPLTDSLEFFGVMYDMSDKQIKSRISELSQQFDLAVFIDQPVRKLSLGQRMRAEVAASLMHKPEIIFLDEPTIGLDVVAKKALRDLLLKVNKEEGVTIFLTSHDVGDIETLCTRTIVVNHGEIMKDLPTSELGTAFAFEKYIELTAAQSFAEFPKLSKGLTYVSQAPEKVVVSVNTQIVKVQDALKLLMRSFEVSDVDVYSTDLETVIRHMYEAASPRT